MIIKSKEDLSSYLLKNISVLTCLVSKVLYNVKINIELIDTEGLFTFNIVKSKHDALFNLLTFDIKKEIPAEELRRLMGFLFAAKVSLEINGNQIELSSIESKMFNELTDKVYNVISIDPLHVDQYESYAQLPMHQQIELSLEGLGVSNPFEVINKVKLFNANLLTKVTNDKIWHLIGKVTNDIYVYNKADLWLNLWNISFNIIHPHDLYREAVKNRVCEQIVTKNDIHFRVQTTLTNEGSISVYRPQPTQPLASPIELGLYTTNNILVRTQALV